MMKPLTEVANTLGIPEKTLYTEHKKGNLPLTILGRNRFVEETDLQAMLQNKRADKYIRRELTPEQKERAAERLRKMHDARRKSA